MNQLMMQKIIPAADLGVIGENMEVMTLHKWFDVDVEKVLWEGHENNREIVLKENNEGALIINVKDVIALAKEFGFVVYHKDASL